MKIRNHYLDKREAKKMDGILFYNDVNFDTFHIAESNCKAAWEAKQFAMNPYEHGTFYLYGKKGNGRTHLTTSIEMEWAEKGIHFRELIVRSCFLNCNWTSYIGMDFQRKDFVRNMKMLRPFALKIWRFLKGKKSRNTSEN